MNRFIIEGRAKGNRYYIGPNGIITDSDQAIVYRSLKDAKFQIDGWRADYPAYRWFISRVRFEKIDY